MGIIHDQKFKSMESMKGFSPPLYSSSKNTISFIDLGVTFIQWKLKESDSEFLKLLILMYKNLRHNEMNH